MECGTALEIKPTCRGHIVSGQLLQTWGQRKYLGFYFTNFKTCTAWNVYLSMKYFTERKWRCK